MIRGQFLVIRGQILVIRGQLWVSAILPPSWIDNRNLIPLRNQQLNSFQEEGVRHYQTGTIIAHWTLG